MFTDSVEAAATDVDKGSKTCSAGLHPGGTDLQLELNGENTAFPELNHLVDHAAQFDSGLTRCKRLSRSLKCKHELARRRLTARRGVKGGSLVC